MRERDLSRMVVGQMRHRGFLIQRIESGTTGRGIPDIYWAKAGQDGWLELKVIKTPFSGLAHHVTWRPGQNVWMYRCNKAKPNSCFTVLFDQRTFYQIAMNQIYKPTDKVVIVSQSTELMEVLF